jgi:hypothetical protein
MHNLFVKQIHDTVSRPSFVKNTSLFAMLFASLLSCMQHPLKNNGSVTEKITEAYGGRERLTMVKSVAAEGQITALMRGDEGVYNRTFRRDGKLFVDISYTRSTEKRILNGSKGFRGTVGQTEEVHGPRYLAMVYQYNELNLPFGLLDNSFTVKELPNDTQNSTDVRVLLCTDRAGNEMKVFVNAESYRIVKSFATFDMGGQTTSLSAEFSDFRLVDGILFPFRIVNYAGGRKISETIITRYVVNPPTDDSLFAP